MFGFTHVLPCMKTLFLYTVTYVLCTHFVPPRTGWWTFGWFPHLWLFWIIPSWTYACKFICEYNLLLESHIERETDGQRASHPLGHSPNAHKGRGWARPKPGAGNSIQVSYVDDRDLTPWATARCRPGFTIGAWDPESRIEIRYSSGRSRLPNQCFNHLLDRFMQDTSQEHFAFVQYSRLTKCF